MTDHLIAHSTDDDGSGWGQQPSRASPSRRGVVDLRALLGLGGPMIPRGARGARYAGDVRYRLGKGAWWFCTSHRRDDSTTRSLVFLLSSCLRWLAVAVVEGQVSRAGE